MELETEERRDFSACAPLSSFKGLRFKEIQKLFITHWQTVIQPWSPSNHSINQNVGNLPTAAAYTKIFQPVRLDFLCSTPLNLFCWQPKGFPEIFWGRPSKADANMRGMMGSRHKRPISLHLYRLEAFLNVCWWNYFGHLFISETSGDQHPVYYDYHLQDPPGHNHQSHF